jgi:hypothetical protein
MTDRDNPDPALKLTPSVIEGGSELREALNELFQECIAPRPSDPARVAELLAKLNPKGKDKLRLAGGTATFKL